ncbi:hypothetical protein Y788_06865 [Pantoea dispersa 625]|nr:hypothetical protein Y788_06865 [Pantoea dispersa 625]
MVVLKKQIVHLIILITIALNGRNILRLILNLILQMKIHLRYLRAIKNFRQIR